MKIFNEKNEKSARRKKQQNQAETKNKKKE
jgi:hypothetical protein